MQKNGIQIVGSQHGQDSVIIDIMRGKKQGYYVDVGCGHPLRFSNTYILERYFDWDGIGFDGNPKFIAAHHRLRDGGAYQHVIYPVSGMDVQFITANEIGGVPEYFKELPTDMTTRRAAGEKTIQRTISLQHALERYHVPLHIDYMSVDLEGAEFVVLQSFFESNTSHVIDVLTVEINENADALNGLLTTYGYHIQRIHGDFIAVRRNSIPGVRLGLNDV
jgi:hypothetical protein